MMHRKHLPVLLIATLGLSAGSLFGAVTLPSWNGQPNTTSQVFQFTTGSTTPGPNSSSNPYGTATGVVDQGAVGNGWEDPNTQFSNPGHDGDGSWDVGLGSDGSLSFNVPVAPGMLAPGQSYRIDIMIFAHVFVSLAQPPVPSVDGLAPGDLVLQNQGVLSTYGMTGATWQYRTWTGTLEDYTSGAITVALTPPNGAVSAIDRVEIYTQYTLVPEPTAPLLTLIPLAAWCLRRRRR